MINSKNIPEFLWLDIYQGSYGQFIVEVKNQLLQNINEIIMYIYIYNCKKTPSKCSTKKYLIIKSY